MRDKYARGWLQQAVGLQDPGEALKLSLRAVSMTTMGRLCKDEMLAFEGGKYYGTALQQLRTALQSDSTVWHDETLAASLVLAVYEVGPS